MAAPDLAASSAADCSSYQYAFEAYNPKWMSGGGTSARAGYDYYVNPTQLPAGNATLTYLVNGHLGWNNTRNDCGFSDQKNFVAAFVGDAYRSAATSGDGYNVVDFAKQSPPLGCQQAPGTTVLACTSYRYYRSSSGPSQMVEADTRWSAPRWC